MNKLFHYLKWALNWNRWYPFQRRFVIYALLGIGLMFINDKLLIVGPALIWLDFMVTLIKESYDKYIKEQEQLLKSIKGDKNVT